MKSKKPRISFEDWIAKVGVDFIAEKIGVNRFTVLHWKAFRTDPCVKHLRKLRQLSKGVMTYERMIDRATPTNGGTGRAPKTGPNNGGAE